MSTLDTVPSLPPAVVSSHATAIDESVRLLSSSSSLSSSSASSTNNVAAATSSFAAAASSISSQPMRVNGLDASALDSELNSMLLHSFMNSLRFFDFSSSSSSWLDKPEFELILNSIIFFATIGADEPTPGMKLQNLRLQNWAAVESVNQRETTAVAASASSSITNALSRLTSLFTTWHTWLGLSKGARGSGGIDTIRDMLPPTDSASSSLAPPFTLSNLALAATNGGEEGNAPSMKSSPATSLLPPLPLHTPLSLSRRQKALYFLLSILVRYIWTKWNAYLLNEGWSGAPVGSWQRRMYEWTRKIEIVYQAGHILNFIVYLKYGVYRTLLERMLSIRLLYLRSNLSRSLSFEFMNQQIAWSSLSEFMLFALPLMNFDWIQDMWSWIERKLIRGRSGEVKSEEESSTSCPVCSSPAPIQPYRALPCRHIFCYYCLAANRIATHQAHRSASFTLQQQYECPACSQRIVNQIPLETTEA